MDKRYQVFVSSTFEDLQEERREVMQALLGLDCIPTGMELFPAADEDSLSLIERFISQCDYYVVIVGGRYGSVTPAGLSYTEMEYDFAIKAGIPVLAFLHGDPGIIATNRTEASDTGKTALQSFRKKIEGKRNAKYWTSPKELPGLVVMSMSSLMKIKPRTGWVRADRVPDESAAQEILNLRNEITRLQKSLDDLKDSPPEGSSELSQGDETIDLRFRIEGDLVQSYSFSWNTLIEVLGPVLMNSPTEDELKNRMVAAWDNRYHAKEYHSNIVDEDFQKVKVQFKALGLIRQIGPARWLLTPHGDSVLMRLAAIKSKFQSPT
jgi:hypothetical protein